MRAGGFVKKVINWAQNNEELRIVDDQIGNPTWARTLAILSTHLVRNNYQDFYPYIEEKKGTYHLGGGGFTSRYEWTKAIVDYLPGDVPMMVKTILPAKTVDFPTPAKRPLFSALDCSKFESTFSLKIPIWELATKLMLKN
jgi:dTDP-4-dehydrorhamnose reductase